MFHCVINDNNRSSQYQWTWACKQMLQLTFLLMGESESFHSIDCFSYLWFHSELWGFIPCVNVSGWSHSSKLCDLISAPFMLICCKFCCIQGHCGCQSWPVLNLSATLSSIVFQDSLIFVSFCTLYWLLVSQISFDADTMWLHKSLVPLVYLILA